MEKSSNKDINQIQNEIIKSFNTISNNRELTINYIIDIGKNMESLEKKYKNNNNIIEGCMSRVWLVYKVYKNRIIFQADSNTSITKGLISILIQILSNQKIDDIINSDLYFIKKIKMNQIIGMQRSNGFNHMIKKIKLFAISEKLKK
jgi:cysteine desulfuration protein SufE